MDSRLIVSSLPPERTKELFAELAEGRWLRVEAQGPRPVVLMRFGRVDGRLVCTGLLLGAEAEAEISARTLRDVPLGQLTSQARLNVGVEWWLEHGLMAPVPAPIFVSRPGPKGHPREHFAQVAAAYRQALHEAPDAPVQYLTRRFLTPDLAPVPESTVRRWLQRSRDMKMLGPSMPGRAGEQRTTTARRKKK